MRALLAIDLQELIERLAARLVARALPAATCTSRCRCATARNRRRLIGGVGVGARVRLVMAQVSRGEAGFRYVIRHAAFAP